MNYRELKKMLGRLSEDQLDMSITVFVLDEFLPAKFIVAEEIQNYNEKHSDVVEKTQPVIVCES